MGSRSAKYTGWKKQPDPRILDEKTFGEAETLLMIRGEVARAHPSTRRERRAALKRMKLHMKTKLGIPPRYGRRDIPPKFPSRPSGGTGHIVVDARKFG